MDRAVLLENVIKGFGYDKYNLGTELRNQIRAGLIIRVNSEHVGKL